MRIPVLFVLLAGLAGAACNRHPKPAPGTWVVSKDGKSWSPVTLPDTDWKCSDCDRSYETTIHGVPKAVKFRFASDNKARLLVNGTVVFADYWKDNYCSDEACCGKCCDSPESCAGVIAKAKEYALPASALAAFKDGDNDVVWQVHQEAGGSGFQVVMNVAN